jgi:hypothetical protein
VALSRSRKKVFSMTSEKTLEIPMMMMSFICSCRNKIGAELHTLMPPMSVWDGRESNGGWGSGRREEGMKVLGVGIGRRGDKKEEDRV